MVKKIKSVLVSMPQWVGDSVMSVPSLKLLRQTLGAETKITLFMLPHLVPILKDLPCHDNVITYRKAETKTFRGLVGLRTRLKKEKFDATLTLSNSFRSAVPPFLAGIPMRCGYKGDYRNFLLTQRLEDSHCKKENKYSYTGDYLCTLTRHFLESFDYDVSSENPPLELGYSDDVYQSYENYKGKFPEGEKRIGIIPASSFGTSRLWPAKYFAEIADRLIMKGFSVNFLCGPGEEIITENILKLMKNKLPMPPIVPLAELKPFVKELDLVITGDTGPRHYAAAMKTPTIIMMGATSPEISVSQHDDITILRKTEYNCVPCNQPTCSAERHKCMEDITPDDVFNAAIEKLSL